MATGDDIKSKVVDLLRGPFPKSDEKTERKKRARVRVTGSGNIVGVGEHVHIKHQVVERTIVQPGADAIPPAQARQIQNMVEQLVDIDEAAGVLSGERTKLFAKWYRAIKDRYDVPSYRCIACAKADDVSAWLTRMIEIERDHLDEAGRRRLVAIQAKYPHPPRG